jgi:hypothetical protein
MRQKFGLEAARQQVPDLPILDLPVPDPPASGIIRSRIGLRVIGFREAGRRDIPACSPKKSVSGPSRPVRRTQSPDQAQRGFAENFAKNYSDK